jgi:hypothetical protein
MTNTPTTTAPNFEHIAFNLATTLRVLELVQSEPDTYSDIDPTGWIEALTDETLDYFDGVEVTTGVDTILSLRELRQRTADIGDDLNADDIAAFLAMFDTDVTDYVNGDTEYEDEDLVFEVYIVEGDGSVIPVNTDTLNDFFLAGAIDDPR